MAEDADEDVGAITTEPLDLARGLEGVAHLVATAEPRRAVRLAGAAAALRVRHGLELTGQDRAGLEGWLAEARRCLGAAASAAAWVDGQRETLEHTIGLALELADATGTDRSTSATPA